MLYPIPATTNLFKFYSEIRILPIPAGRYKMQWQKFQFPTGWNSTIWIGRILIQSVVSIPNGMEFYQVMALGGISTRLFQFPTGWNSTIPNPINLSKPQAGFNSQRDGILQKRKQQNQLKNAVSIPNGMEFYVGVIETFKPTSRVSIPNGMEFYHDIRHLIGTYCMFQFPTGWNSTKAHSDQA